MLSELIDRIRPYMADGDFALLERAYNFSTEAHKDQKRASGESFFIHAFAVACNLTELKLDMATICAALLHDVLEDTTITHVQMEKEFGSEITALVEGVTKINSYKFADRELAQAENWRKMLLAVTRDVRVILIKLADRLHNLRTIKYLPPEKQRIIATESLNLYAPFAQRLGIYRWKSEIEDLSFEVLMPEAFSTLRDQWQKKQETNLKYLEEWKSVFEEMLAPTGIPFNLSARPKSIYGTYKKMQRQHKDLSEIQDLLGFRVITDSIASCYAILGLVHSRFKPVPNTFTDYISLPKTNMYQSLHTTIFGPNEVIAEIQIRTEEMHRRCEYGIAAHWRYKEKGDSRTFAAVRSHGEIEERLDWLKQVLEWQQDLKDPREFLTALKVECTFDEIFVFTPKGKVMKLPSGATPIDFAYAVHSDVGNHCYGAKVGNKMQPLTYVLKSGEICEILTRKNVRPNEDWLKMAITARARAKIRKYLKDNGGEKHHFS